MHDWNTTQQYQNKQMIHAAWKKCRDIIKSKRY